MTYLQLVIVVYIVDVRVKGMHWQGNVEVVLTVTVEVKVNVDDTTALIVLVVVLTVNPPGTTTVLVSVVVLVGTVVVPSVVVASAVLVVVVVAVTTFVEPACELTKQLHALLATSSTIDRSGGGQSGATSPRTLGAARFFNSMMVTVW
ncbi:hypothetical protein DE146DRAFT_751493 [Phaeosphaeria sp. MPI-PUGE-AT-0046c]|nr:hypothetical protein DE146DRAFT_751493 [Phaeosphaeria sp. MPI-PUGE-AT-0046c]